MFELDKQKVSVSKVTIISGNTDEETGNGVTLTCEAQCDGETIDAFDANLRKSFFRKQRKDDQMDLDKPNEGLCMLQFPRIDEVAWEEDYPGYNATIASDGLFDDAVEFSDVKLRIKSFKFIEGGRTAVRFNLNIYPSERVVKGELADLQKQVAVITLVSPASQK